jgi:hypothetical protein
MTRGVPIPKTVTLHVPFRIVKRGGRREMQLPKGATQPRGADNTLVRALARGFRWKCMLESGEFSTITELAQREQLTVSFLTRILGLTQLAPDIVEAVLDARQGVKSDAGCCPEVSAPSLGKTEAGGMDSAQKKRRDAVSSDRTLRLAAATVANQCRLCGRSGRSMGLLSRHLQTQHDRPARRKGAGRGNAPPPQWWAEADVLPSRENTAVLLRERTDPPWAPLRFTDPSQGALGSNPLKKRAE